MSRLRLDEIALDAEGDPEGLRACVTLHPGATRQSTEQGSSPSRDNSNASSSDLPRAGRAVMAAATVQIERKGKLLAVHGFAHDGSSECLASHLSPGMLGGNDGSGEGHAKSLGSPKERERRYAKASRRESDDATFEDASSYKSLSQCVSVETVCM